MKQTVESYRVIVYGSNIYGKMSVFLGKPPPMIWSFHNRADAEYFADSQKNISENVEVLRV